MAKILIVDDSAFMRAKLRVMFESGGHEVVGLAPSGEQALELFASLHPEIVTLDYLMAGKNGEEVLREMIQQDPEAKVIMISGSGDRTIEERSLQIENEFVVVGRPIKLWCLISPTRASLDDILQKIETHDAVH